MNNDSTTAPPDTDDALVAADFWLRLEISLELIRDAGSDRCLRSVIAEYDGLAERLTFDMSRDVTRWAMWQHARTLLAANPQP